MSRGGRNRYPLWFCLGVLEVGYSEENWIGRSLGVEALV
jgi:hypothetical protein